MDNLIQMSLNIVETETRKLFYQYEPINEGLVQSHEFIVTSSLLEESRSLHNNSNGEQIWIFIRIYVMKSAQMH
ncbi:hypothetical protein P879_10265 [Paragonimus westermani]|uniref:Uncharacterized protein n=1 Tax=Paragonimus westermani TaxID=34504 RepID=A0A8T0D4G7_9TREM|nr:hypothetical protein P879_10265 [Paragonimus westermani]